MLFTINPNDGLPIYRQLARQVRHMVAAEKLKKGDKLPSHRDLAKDLVINHLTVKKAYESLEAEGLIETLRGRGTYIAGSRTSGLQKEGLRDLSQHVRALIDEARLLGVEKKEFERMTDTAWRMAVKRLGEE